MTTPTVPPEDDPNFVPNNYIQETPDTPPPVGRCFVYDRDTGNGTTEFQVQQCNAYTFPGEVVWPAHIVTGSTDSALPETGSGTANVALGGSLAVLVGIGLCYLARWRYV